MFVDVYDGFLFVVVNGYVEIVLFFFEYGVDVNKMND